MAVHGTAWRKAAHALRRYVHPGHTVLEVGARFVELTLFGAQLVVQSGSAEPLVDVPSYMQRPHHRLLLVGFVSTSIGLIVQRSHCASLKTRPPLTITTPALSCHCSVSSPFCCRKDRPQ